ncbi:MAG TPA: hypothetical protein VHN20_07930 [Beijerinckiaceae bacterium]|nr:hypothetical protein [Beijerinckiaceae bacterium]
MNRLESDDLPPELSELGERLTAERPVADDHALDSVMSRAQSVSRPRKSLMWRSSAPKARRKSLALAIAGVMATAGIGGLAVAGAGAVDSNPPPPVVTSCPNIGDMFLVGVVAQLGDTVQGGEVVAVDVTIGNLVGVCIRIGDLNGFSANNILVKLNALGIKINLP